MLRGEKEANKIELAVAFWLLNIHRSKILRFCPVCMYICCFSSEFQRKLLSHWLHWYRGLDASIEMWIFHFNLHILDSTIIIIIMLMKKWNDEYLVERLTYFFGRMLFHVSFPKLYSGKRFIATQNFTGIFFNLVSRWIILKSLVDLDEY